MYGTEELGGESGDSISCEVLASTGQIHGGLVQDSHGNSAPGDKAEGRFWYGETKWIYVASSSALENRVCVGYCYAQQGRNPEDSCLSHTNEVFNSQFWVLGFHPLPLDLVTIKCPTEQNSRRREE